MKPNGHALSSLPGEELQQMFFLNHMVTQAFQKSGAAFATSGEVPQIPTRNPENVGDYGK